MNTFDKVVSRLVILHPYDPKNKKSRQRYPNRAVWLREMMERFADTLQALSERNQ